MPDTPAAPLRDLHIALISPALPKSGLANGIVTYVGYMRDALRAAGHRVSVIAGDAFEDALGDEHAIPAVSRPQRFITHCRARLQPSRRDIVASSAVIAGAAYHVHERDPIDVIEVEESFGWATRLSRLGPRIVVRLHGPHVYGRDSIESPDERRRGDQRELEEVRGMRRAAALSCPSARLLDAMLTRYEGVFPVAAAIPNPMPVVPPGRRWQLHDADPHQILTVGRFDTRKGADIVLTAFQEVARQRSNVRLVLAGPDYGLSTPSGARIHFDEFVRAEIDPAVRPRIVFLGKQSATEIEMLRRQSAFSVIGSRFENFPYSLAEAMALGTASIVSDSFGNGEMVLDGETGLVVPVDDRSALARAMLALCDDPERSAAMAAAAWHRCSTWLDPHRIASETAALYRRAGA